MVKIKRKVEMTLPELIEWGFKNNIRNTEFVSNFFEKKSVIFNLSGWAEFSDEYAYLPEDTFTVEVEEEITKDTKLDRVLEIYKDLHSPGSVSSVIQKNTSINNIMEYNPSYFKTECLYLINEDMTLTLIWKDGELVGDK
ncbi:hypothetical protein FH141_08080 [Staphylococcus hominis]|uniref:hypothetical protein n=1 Tax=Staphylococcus hominis TaxID=1290 RepID=UPI001F58A979|nr:hypothetical protein [Staphylococcus hominis]MCI2919059.1 hypothetical protein [Staphylococcus hominis]MDS3927151.1 hypothetical protein [Staphylococcus hominis]